MRATFNSLFRGAAADITRASEELAARQRQVSSGRRFQGPGDDPHAALSAIRERSEIATLDSYVRAADSGGSRLLVVDGMLSDLVTQVTRAQVATTGSLGSSGTPAQKAAAAVELEAIRDAIFSDLTTTFQGAYLFSGTSATTVPYTKDASGNISGYAGTTSTARVDIDRQMTVQTSFDGDAITRGSGANDVFVVLTNIITAIRAGTSSAVETGLQELNGVFDQLTRAQTGVGGDLRQIDERRLRLGSLRAASMARLSKHETVDTVEAVLGLQAANRAYEAALAAASVRTQLSLMDFLG